MSNLKKVKLLSVTVLAISLTACIKAPTFEERLAGKTGAGREKEVYYACIQHANAPIPGGHSGDYIGHEVRMRTLCDDMRNVNRKTPDNKLANISSEEKRTILAEECGKEIKNGLNKDNQSNVRYFEKTKQICEEMTGKSVIIK